MDDWILTAPVSEVWVISFVQQIQHYRARAEVERHTSTHHEVWVGLKGELESALLDLGHSDSCSRSRPLDHCRIAQQFPIRHNGSETVHMDDVVQLRIGWRLAH
jgi:hypothetical protein